MELINQSPETDNIDSVSLVRLGTFMCSWSVVSWNIDLWSENSRQLEFSLKEVQKTRWKQSEYEEIFSLTWRG